VNGHSREAFLTYYYNRFKFEFYENAIYITDIQWKRKYRMNIKYDNKEDKYPFILELVEQS
jgi:hypothetical protein